MSHTIILPLLAERGEGRGEESNQNAYEFAGRPLVPPEPLRVCTLSASIGERAGVRCRIPSPRAAIQSAQAAGYSDWLAADEAALAHVATRIAPKFGVVVD